MSRLIQNKKITEYAIHLYRFFFFKKSSWNLTLYISIHISLGCVWCVYVCVWVYMPRTHYILQPYIPMYFFQSVKFYNPKKKRYSEMFFAMIFFSSRLNRPFWHDLFCFKSTRRGQAYCSRLPNVRE